MGRRLLAGPFPIVDTNGNWKANIDLSMTNWWQNVGLFSRFNNSIDPVTGGAVLTGQNLGMVALDGLYQDCSDTFAGGISWDTNSGTYRLIGGSVPYKVTPRAFCFFPMPIGSWNPNGNSVLLKDREIFAGTWFGQAQVWSNHYNGDNSGGLPGNIFFTLYVEANNLWNNSVGMGTAIGRGVGELLIFEYNSEPNYYSGHTATATRFAFYDIKNRKLATPVMDLGQPCYKLMFAPEYGMLISIQSTGGVLPYTVSFWSLDCLPTAVSSPVLIAGVVGPGQLATYQVTVVGAQNDVAVGQLVDWSISGAGVLLSPQSKTDNQGNATVQVLYDPTVVVGATSTITASVTC